MPSTPPPTRALCFGNRFAGDDGFGPAVCDALHARTLPSSLEVVDAGLAGAGSAMLFEDCTRAVIVDGVRGWGSPGELFVILPDEVAHDGAPASAHGLGLGHLLLTLPISLGEFPVPELVIVGMEIESTDFGAPLSPAIARGVEDAAQRVLDAVARPGTLTEWALAHRETNP